MSPNQKPLPSVYQDETLEGLERSSDQVDNFDTHGKMRKYILTLSLAALAACTSPQPVSVGAAPEDNPTVVPAPLEAVWWAIIDVVGEYDLELETMDLGRGYIRSQRTAFEDATVADYWACAPEPIFEPDGVLSIRAVPINDGETSLEVSAVPIARDGRLCASNGILEDEVGDRVFRRWQELVADQQ